MDIKSTENGSKGRYVLSLDGYEGEMTYSRASPELIILDHTGVADELRGRGVGQALAQHVVTEARNGGWKVIPLCPFFKAQVARHPEWSDVIA